MKFRSTGPHLWLNSQTGYFCAVYVDDAGKSRRKSLGTKDKKEATRRFNAWHRDFLTRWGSEPARADSSQSISVSDFADEWVKHIEARHPESTTTQYRATARKMAEMFGEFPVKDFSVRTIERFIDDLIHAGLAPATVNKHRRHLRIMLNDAEEWGYTPRRPKMPRPIHEKQRVKYFTPDQLDALFSAIDNEEFRDFCLLALLSALRSGELMRLTVEDVNNPAGFLRISEAQKNRTESRIPITSAIAPIVEKYSTIRATGRLFPYSSPSYVSRLFKQYREIAGLPDGFSFHSLRHSYGTSMVLKGADITAIKELMRHKSIASTMVYAKVVPSHLTATGELMDFTPSDRREIVEGNATKSSKKQQ